MKKKMLAATSRDTVRSNTGRSARSVVYDFTKDYADAAQRLAGTLDT